MCLATGTFIRYILVWLIWYSIFSFVWFVLCIDIMSINVVLFSVFFDPMPDSSVPKTDPNPRLDLFSAGTRYSQSIPSFPALLVLCFVFSLFCSWLLKVSQICFSPGAADVTVRPTNWFLSVSYAFIHFLIIPDLPVYVSIETSPRPISYIIPTFKPFYFNFTLGLYLTNLSSSMK